jgi:hypothetical protein
MQLVRVIQAGVDVNGDEVADLDPDSVYYTGISLGGMYGAQFLAVEPDVSAGALLVLGGPAIDRLRFGGVNRAGSGLLGQTAGTAVVSHGLLNTPGITRLDGLTVPAPYFNENMPLRDGVPLNVTVLLADGSTENRVIQSPVTNDVDGAMAIQQVFDNWEWVSLGGDPLAYAPYLRKDPLPGVDAKSVLVQFAKGDVYAENPTTTAFLRAGDLADRATYYRYDLTPVYSQDPNLRQPVGYPHTFAALATSTNLTIQAVALAAQRQIAAFFASDGTQIIQPPGVATQYFEVGMDESELPEGLNYTLVASPLAPVGAAAAASDGSSGAGGDSWDRGASIAMRAPDVRRDLLGLARRATTTQHAEQREHIPVVSDEHAGALDEVLTVAMRTRRSAGLKLVNVAAVDDVFADNEWDLAAPFQRPAWSLAHGRR